MQHLWFVMYGIEPENKKLNDNYLPQVTVILGELLGRYLNDFVMKQEIRRNEVQLWSVNKSELVTLLITFMKFL